jgi:Lar family restriction alleviation protein
MKAMQKKTTKRRKNERKPCPFCGSLSSTVTVDPDDRYFESVYVACDHCSCRTGSYPIEEDAIEHWNQRVDVE